MATSLVYATTTGNTETVAGYIAEASGLEAEDIASADISGSDCIIIGAPTWNTVRRQIFGGWAPRSARSRSPPSPRRAQGADEQRSGTDMDGFLFETLPGLDVSGKKVAIFGVGDQSTYSANFCDAAGEIYDLMTAAGATVVGMTSTDGYEHEESKVRALRGGRSKSLFLTAPASAFAVDSRRQVRRHDVRRGQPVRPLGGPRSGVGGAAQGRGHLDVSRAPRGCGGRSRCTRADAEALFRCNVRLRVASLACRCADAVATYY